MSKILHSITVRGKTKEWMFDVYVERKYVKEWQEDGLEIAEVINQIPLWVNDAGLTHIWCFLQDIFNFKNPFKE